MLELSNREKHLLLVLLIVILAGVLIMIYTKLDRQPVELEAYKREETSTEQVFSHIDEEVASNDTFLVHVSGAVNNPGVYELKGGSRVIDAIELAGGITEDADPHAINLAKKVTDEEKVHVPKQGENIGDGNLTQSENNKVNINLAGQSELETLPGIGPVLAKRIITHREQNGKFQKPEDITNVTGIGTKRFEELKNLISVN